MTLDPVLLARQVQRQQRKERVRIGLLLGYYWVACTLVSFVFASLYRVPFPQRFFIAGSGGLIGSTVIMVAVRVVQGMMGRGALAVLEPGGRGREKAVYSHAEALAVTGNLEAAGKAFEQARVEHGERASLLRAEADVYLRADGDPARARELLMRLRRSSDASRADELYATHRLVDLYLGPLRDEARAMAELRRLAERFPGTPDARGALEALARHRASMKDESEPR
ncbi:tetratricopeptide repeat protein [Gemmatimonas sp.]|uniref:tetratricopeptide repeat protein n=1 Tax=Gemmatimonas sp. TaxID=1962908 RepID=UPI0037BF2ED3